METVFILHGGLLIKDDPRNDSFFVELTKNLTNGDKILSVGFAKRNKKKRAEIFERDKKLILAQTDKDVVITNATHDNFVEQVNQSDVIFITGGEAAGLIDDIKKYPDFVNAIKGKVIAGSSAGVALFVKYYFTFRSNGVCKGLGIIPVRFIGHYGNPDFGGTKESLKLLERYPDDSEVVVIEECDWIVKKIDL